MLVEVRVKSLGLDGRNNHPVVILEEMEGERVLPIWIGPGEAGAIAYKLGDVEVPRPLTHDLIVSIIKGMGGQLEQVAITHLSDDTFYAVLLIRKGTHAFKIDARPSDSIAVALRLGAPIMAAEELLERVSVEVTEDSGVVHLESSEGERHEVHMSPEELQDHIRKLLPQDFGRFIP